MYYNLLFENSYFDPNLIKDAYPIKCSKEAIQMLINHIKERCNELLRKDEMTKDIRQAENEEKKKLLEENRKLKSEIEDKNDQIEMFLRKMKGGLSLANTFGFKYKNKKKDLAPMLHSLFGWGEAKIAAYLSTPCDNNERDELANLFKDLCPDLYATIMNRGELPPEVTPSKENVTCRKG